MSNELNGLRKQDARDAKKVLPENEIDLVITSPPYYDLKDYGPDNQIGFGQKYNEYLEDIELVFEGIYDALDEQGSLWMIVDTFKQEKDVKMLPYDITNRLKDVGYKLRDIIIWDKTRTLPWTNEGEMRNVFEYILVFSKSDEMNHFVDRIKDPEDLKKWWIKYPERYNPKGKTPSNIWRFDIPTQGAWSDDAVKHACPFSPGLVERIITLCTDPGDTVFDPFAGTGTVLAQAEAMNRNGVGFELNQNYIDNYEEKIKPKIKEEWRNKNSEREQKDEKRNQLKQRIYDLRRLKYPKTIVRRLINQKGWGEDELSLNTLFAFPIEGEPEDKHKLMNLEVVIVHHNGMDENKLEEDIHHVCKEPPLSKFGISSRLKIIHRDDVNGELKEKFNQNMFLYKNGRFWDNKGEIEYKEWKTKSEAVILETLDKEKEKKRASDWEDKFKNGVPPIISPIKISKDELNFEEWYE